MPPLPPLPPERAPQALPVAEAAPVAGSAYVPLGAPGAPSPTDPALPPVVTPAADAKPSEVRAFIRWIVEFVLLVLAAFLLATALKTWVVQPFYIPSGSMEPTLAIGDRVLVNKFIYRFTSPKRGDVVVFESPEGPKTDLIKRVIATGGQTVQIKDGYVSVDGTKLDEPYVAKDRRDNYTSPTPTKVPQGYVWVMGDNRGNSADSRVIGPQPLSAILGQAFTIYWPIQRFGGL
jgi:signal peptidase I